MDQGHEHAHTHTHQNTPGLLCDKGAELTSARDCLCTHGASNSWRGSRDAALLGVTGTALFCSAGGTQRLSRACRWPSSPLSLEVPHADSHPGKYALGTSSLALCGHGRTQPPPVGGSRLHRQGLSHGPARWTGKCARCLSDEDEVQRVCQRGFWGITGGWAARTRQERKAAAGFGTRLCERARSTLSAHGLQVPTPPWCGHRPSLCRGS